MIPLLDVGSSHAGTLDSRCGGQRQSEYYVIVSQCGDTQTTSEEVVDRYSDNPDAIDRSLAYREDLAPHG